MKEQVKQARDEAKKELAEEKDRLLKEFTAQEQKRTVREQRELKKAREDAFQKGYKKGKNEAGVVNANKRIKDLEKALNSKRAETRNAMISTIKMVIDFFRYY